MNALTSSALLDMVVRFSRLNTILEFGEPFNSEDIENLCRVVPVSVAVCILDIALQRGKLLARSCHWRHKRHVERLEVGVEGVHRISVFIDRNRCRDDLLRNFLQTRTGPFIRIYFQNKKYCTISPSASRVSSSCQTMDIKNVLGVISRRNTRFLMMPCC